jgi:hypothetical protein
MVVPKTTLFFCLFYYKQIRTAHRSDRFEKRSQIRSNHKTTVYSTVGTTVIWVGERMVIFINQWYLLISLELHACLFHTMDH